jgi:hypothetical protein
MTKPDDQNPSLHVQYRQSLGDQVNSIEQEARMVLPGIQALFGFQLIAVFNQGFKLSLTGREQILHLVALLLVAISSLLVLAPAAYHRQANHQISEHFVKMSSQFLAWAMAPLAAGICLDVYLVTEVVLQSMVCSVSIAIVLSLLYTWTWFIFPRLRGRRLRDLPVHQLSGSARRD